jgi:hypothetical protein
VITSATTVKYPPATRARASPKDTLTLTEMATFSKAGTFTCASLQHKDAKVKVTVKGM